MTMLQWFREIMGHPVPWPVPEGTTIRFDNVRVQHKMIIEVDDDTWRSNPEWRDKMSNLRYEDGRLYWCVSDAK